MKGSEEELREGEGQDSNLIQEKGKLKSDQVDGDIYEACPLQAQ